MSTNADEAETAGRKAPRRGDIFWITLSEEQGSVPPIPHPHVVVQDDVFNRSRVQTLIVCAMTSNLRKANEPGNVLLDVGEGGLPKQSVVVVSQVSSVAKADLGALVGTLSQARVDQILAGLRFQQATHFQDRP
jgi:mRNA interferase MazF